MRGGDFMATRTMKLRDQKFGAFEHSCGKRRSAQSDLQRNFDVHFAHHGVIKMSHLYVFGPSGAHYRNRDCNRDLLSRMTASGFSETCARPKAMSGMRACKHGK
jgi:hypothetical protein